MIGHGFPECLERRGQRRGTHAPARPGGVSGAARPYDGRWIPRFARPGAAVRGIRVIRPEGAGLGIRTTRPDGTKRGIRIG
ncbi:hypothetical protein GCM10010517_12340 [Streptosporangium fragile]|uniref:Uncharacterized protein n=1 Tax=Streptosporangium fragile TaxID=46186 RepID=A0ABN3VS95_9ACTN